MMRARRAAAVAISLLTAAGCSGTGADQYRVVNDTGGAVVVLGCDDCGDGRTVRAGDGADISLSGSALRFLNVDGSVFGCLETINGEPQDRREDIVLSEHRVEDLEPSNAAACRSSTVGGTE